MLCSVTERKRTLCLFSNVLSNVLSNVHHQICRSVEMEHHKGPCRCSCHLSYGDCAPAQVGIYVVVDDGDEEDDDDGDYW